MYAMDKHRVVLSVHKHPQRLGYLLLALSQPETASSVGSMHALGRQDSYRITAVMGHCAS